MKKILMALPKGRILKELNPVLQKAGIIIEDDFFDDASRKIIFKTNIENFEVIKVRSFDVATFVKFGAADIGICGFDVLQEFASEEIFSILDLNIGACRLSIASKSDCEIDYSKKSHVKIATKYINIVSQYFLSKGVQAEIIKLNGAIEIAPKLGLCDFIVDLVSSGKTLAENDMVERKKILDVTSRLIVNRSSLKTANEQINQIIKLFDAA